MSSSRDQYRSVRQHRISTGSGSQNTKVQTQTLNEFSREDTPGSWIGQRDLDEVECLPLVRWPLQGIEEGVVVTCLPGGQDININDRLKGAAIIP